MVTAKLKNQLADITAKASKTVDALLTREKNLDNLLQKSDDLAQKAEEVRKVAEEVYWAMVWRVWKWQIIYFCGFFIGFIGFIVILSLLVILLTLPWHLFLYQQLENLTIRI